MLRSQEGIIRRHQRKLSIFYRLLDALCITFSLLLSCWINRVVWDERCVLIVAVAVGLFYVFAELNELYRSWRAAPFGEEFGYILLSWLGAILVLLFFAYATKTSESYSRRLMVTWFVLSPSVLVIWRFSLRQFLREIRSRNFNTRSVAIVGAGALGKRLARTITSARWMGMRLVGFYDDKKAKGSQPVRDLSARIEGTLEELVQHVHDHKVDQVYIALPLRAGGRIKELVDNLSDTMASVYLIPDLFTFNLLHASWMDLDGIPAISIVENPYVGMGGWIKRLEDIMISSLILLVTAIPMLVISIAVKFTSSGPVIFRQRRHGLDGREIEVWKFRSMTVCENGGEVPQAQRCDPRVTRLGAFLRRTSLDELPQFINVLQGRMSVVGPRPHALAHNEQYRKVIRGYMLRHKVKPGITGYAQVSGWRGETDTFEKMEKRVEYDIEYIQNWSVWLDLKIIVLTIFKGFTGENAY